MHWSTLPRTDQIFTHCGETEQTVFAASALRRHCEDTKHPISSIPIEASSAKLILAQRGLERPRLFRAIARPVHLPLLYVAQRDGSHLLIDGSHTYVARFYRAASWAEAYLVPESIWANFLVEGLPTIDEATLLTSHSGVTL